MSRARALILTVLLLPLCAPAARQNFSPDDLWLWRTAADARISPDGRWIVYVETMHDRAANATYSHLWLATSDGKQNRPLTQGARVDTSPRWAPDNERVAYLSGGQIHVRRVSGDADSQLTSSAQPPLALAWSPDGNSIAYSARVPAKSPAITWAPAAILQFLSPAPSSRVQLFIVPAAGGPARQITTGDLDWLGEPGWLEDGRAIVCQAAPVPDAGHVLEGGELYAIRLADLTMTQLTDHPGPDEEPVPSPDASRLAWIAVSDKPQSYSVRHLYVMNADGKRAKLLSGALDRDVQSPQWSSDSRTVYFLADDHGSTHVYAARNDGTARQVTKNPERLRGFSMADNGRAATVRSSATEGGNVVTFAIDLPGGVITAADPNGQLLADRNISPAEEFAYQSDGRAIQAWLVKPPNFDPAAKYPLLLDIQDAPRAMYGYEFQLRAQIEAAAGYVVLYANPRGAPGYGEEFGNLLHTRYPGDDADDLLRGVDAAVAKGYIDPKRMAVSGGLVAAWLLGHTDRFAAAVLQRPVVDWLTHIATSGDGYRRAAAWMGALPWDDPDQYVKHSPVYFARDFKTPALVIAEGQDPESQELFFALQARKVDSALLRLPDAAKPASTVLALEAALGWLARFTQPPR